MGDMNLIGSAVKRREDYRFLTGAGTYTDDVQIDRQSYAYFVRSPHAHATIKGIGKDEALKAPGVLAVFTGEDLAAGKVAGLPCGWLITGVDGQPMNERARRVRRPSTTLRRITPATSGRSATNRRWTRPSPRRTT